MQRIDDLPALGRARSAPATDIMTQLSFIYPRETRQGRPRQDFIVAIQYTLNIHLEDQAVCMVENGRVFFVVFLSAIHIKIDAFLHIIDEAGEGPRKGDNPAGQQLATAAVPTLSP